MRIAVCIKQVPILAALHFDPFTKTIKRDGVRTEISSFDVRALLKAVDLKDRDGGEVVVITMGPPQARDALLEGLALGADRAIHLCDPAFAGADTLATARTLAAALKNERFDLILCGRASVDAETAQVGPEIAELLDLPQITATHSIVIDRTSRSLIAKRETDEGYETVSSSLPALVTAAEDLAPERFPTKADRENAAGKPIETMDLACLGLDTDLVGAAGSPTWVAELRSLETTRGARIIDAPTPEEAAKILARLLVLEHGLFGTWKVHEQPTIGEIAQDLNRSEAGDVWVVAEELGGNIRRVTLEMLSKASELAASLQSTVTALLIGHNLGQHHGQLAAHGADRVAVADGPQFTPFDVEMHAEVVVRALQTSRAQVLLVPATSRGRDLAPRVAARLGLGLTGDCIDLGLDPNGRLLQYKPAFGGSIVAPILSRTLPAMATVRPGMLARKELPVHRTAEVVALAADDVRTRRVTVLASQQTAAGAQRLDDAEIVVGLGRGIGGPDRLAAVQPLIDLLGAATCTTRDVTDAGWMPRQYQVGLTGRAIAPKLYFAVGIRGAFEHMVGVRRAGLIAAINKNAKAPVFKGADYGVVGDYAEVVPALCRHLEQLRRHR